MRKKYFGSSIGNKTASSKNPTKKLAHGGACFVPIVVPITWLKMFF